MIPPKCSYKWDTQKPFMTMPSFFFFDVLAQSLFKLQHSDVRILSHSCQNAGKKKKKKAKEEKVKEEKVNEEKAKPEEPQSKPKAKIDKDKDKDKGKDHDEHKSKKPPSEAPKEAEQELPKKTSKVHPAASAFLSIQGLFELVGCWVHSCSQCGPVC